MINTVRDQLGQTASRSKDRYKRIALSGASSGLAKLVSVAATLTVVPLVFDYLGREGFGLWITITSLITFLSFADLGISSGLVNELSRCNGRDDRETANRLVSNAWASLSLVAITIGVAFLLVAPHVNWGEAFKVRGGATAQEAEPAVTAFVACFLAAMVLGIGQRIHTAYQEVFISQAWVVVGALVSLGATAIAVWSESRLYLLVIAASAGPLVGGACGTFVQLKYSRPWLRPRVRNVSWQVSKRLLTTGSLFFVLAIAGAVGYQTDNIVVARIMGADRVPELAVPMKLFLLVPAVIGMVTTPLWPAHGEAIARGDVAWVKSAVLRSLAWSGLLAVSLATPFAVLAPKFLDLWIGDSIAISTSLRIALWLWALIGGVLMPLAMVFNAANVVGFQVRWSLMMAAANIGLSIYLVGVMGVEGAVYGTVLSQALFLVLPYLVRLRKLFSDLEAQGELSI